MKKLHPADIADIIRNLEPEKRKFFFDSLKPEVGAKVLAELDPVSEIELLKELESPQLSKILNVMPSDDAADVIADLSQEKKDKVLQLMDKEESADVKELLKYPKESAGGIMTIDFLALNENITAGEAIDSLRRYVKKSSPPFFIYVVDEKKKLKGILPLHNLIIVSPQEKLKEIMDKEVISVSVDIDQEKVAQIAAKYNLTVIPVVDSIGKLVGIITSDDIIDVIEEEAEEDIYHMAGSDEQELSNSVFKIARGRLFWLIVTLFGGIFACIILRSFRLTLEKIVTLAFFIPVMMDMAGNVGTQSSTVVVRSLATSNINFSKIWKVLFKEVKIAALIGLMCGLGVGGIAIFLGEHGLTLGLVVCVSMFTAILVAALTGTAVPFIFKHFRVDPAFASGPIVTTINDITALSIYFILASVLFGVIG